MSEKNQREQMVIEAAKNLIEVFMELMNGDSGRVNEDHDSFSVMKYVLGSQARAMALYFCPNTFNGYQKRLEVLDVPEQEIIDGKYMGISRASRTTLALRWMQDMWEESQKRLTEEQYEQGLEQLLGFLEEKHLNPQEGEVQVEQETLYVMNEMTKHRATT